MKKFKKTSKFRVVTRTLVEERTAYLFFVTQPTRNIKKEKNIDKTPIKSKLYSISQTAKFGPQTRFIQKR